MHGCDGMVFIGNTRYITRFLWYKVQKQRGAVLVHVLAVVGLQQIIAYLLLVSS